MTAYTIGGFYGGQCKEAPATVQGSSERFQGMGAKGTCQTMAHLSREYGTLPVHWRNGTLQGGTLYGHHQQKGQGQKRIHSGRILRYQGGTHHWTANGIPYRERAKVKEMTLDMANSMKTIARKCFLKAVQVTDRFHVQKLALEALQNIRIKHRWDGPGPGERTDQTGKGKEKDVHPERIRQRGHKKTTIGQKQVPALQGPQ